MMNKPVSKVTSIYAMVNNGSVPHRGTNLSLCCQIQADFRAHSDSYQMDTYSSFSMGRVAMA